MILKKKTCGRPAYHRGMIFVLVLFCKSKHIYSYEKMANECKDNIVLLKFTGGKTPGHDVFRRFLQNTDKMIFKKIFFGGLARFNDYQYLSFDRMFIDITDTIVSASLNYTTIKSKLRHYSNLKSGEYCIMVIRFQLSKQSGILKKKKKEYSNNTEMLELINVALKKPKIYTKKNFDNISLFLSAMEKMEFIVFPSVFPNLES